MNKTTWLKPSLLALCCIFTVFPLWSKIILWDLGYVLLEPSQVKIARHVGIWDLICYKFGEKKDPHGLRGILFGLLDLARIGEPHNMTVPDDQGKPLNNIMCDYQAGVKSSEQLLEEIHATIEKADADCYFSSKREKRIVEKMMETIFDPIAFARFTQPIGKGVELLKLCANKKDADGNPCHEMMVLSNWDAESFALLKDLKKNQTVFKYFKPENIVISGAAGNHDGLKPHKNAFQRIIDLKQVDPAEIVFIDDQEVNIEAARAMGIMAIHLPKEEKNPYKKVKQELKELGVL